MIKKNDNGRWKADIQIGHDGKRYRKTFNTKAEAIRWEAYIRAQHAQQLEWNPPAKDKRRLSDLIDTWYTLHGTNLKDGHHRKTVLGNICTALGNPKATDVTAARFQLYRTDKTATTSANTLNHHLAYLKAVFNELIRLDNWQQPNPLANVRPLKLQESQVTYLTNDQITRLLAALKTRRNPHVSTIAKICLATGARWSEAESLTAEQVQTYRITYARTKSGKARTVPISEQLYAEINPTGHGPLFGPAYDSFTAALRESGIRLPKGQRTHVLRHTFASHYIMNGGNLLTLQKILGHQSIHMTMRYAHLAPDHLQEAVQLNPLENLPTLCRHPKES